jgi:hypothetical protein
MGTQTYQLPDRDMTQLWIPEDRIQGILARHATANVWVEESPLEWWLDCGESSANGRISAVWIMIIQPVPVIPSGKRHHWLSSFELESSTHQRIWKEGSTKGCGPWDKHRNLEQRHSEMLVVYQPENSPGIRKTTRSACRVGNLSFRLVNLDWVVRFELRMFICYAMHHHK